MLSCSVMHFTQQDVMMANIKADIKVSFNNLSHKMEYILLKSQDLDSHSEVIGFYLVELENVFTNSPQNVINYESQDFAKPLKIQSLPYASEKILNGHVPRYLVPLVNSSSSHLILDLVYIYTQNPPSIMKGKFLPEIYINILRGSMRDITEEKAQNEEMEINGIVLGSTRGVAKQLAGGQEAAGAPGEMLEDGMWVHRGSCWGGDRAGG